MIQPRTILNVADNTGAKIVQCIRPLGGTRKRYASLGDVIVAVVKQAEPRKMVKKHQIVRAVVVRQRQSKRRKDGSYIRFDDNAVVILEGSTKEPKGSRILGPVAREIKEKKFEKIAAIAQEVI
ncbi:MAG: 50S ribosomal protein L14 [Candidatus Nealsonbacteria bacterium CG_4_9_14_3_um_filter_35_11]|uniref:Large ribosomal subunit protein uL14 n=2 Tax=Candidatus Nealsoniibacteriota TaxID=1817911 RepID=A0A2M7DB43_9BACT|nr:MAG: 50S ribosomal protein L14 [Candidatus Nealsonbacteria bacterium CG11_big_fil_rev_8_21_14_0_20_35_11]PIV45678.1 MAG: 50S ribosomal protein L14 [Candidatus Nealsonbacteria bacterium CG02_land_8_20_14_3_00_34_20]PIW92820.1 MAG: 50S ribosomal protein L14 [Candidatus Nealsonbacteria bacterium CG_4_8_14_3_um_filter_34_13]PIZ90125.1 MAG: 50S ribosomal protein L14 [Candidatus Nealsonbacteria bacterium CG_4_10_14_0_2_um_filter_35_20]PJA84442.1 MAG: 50S ribosomal protein L14 [Candidatus Nealsonba